MPRKSKTITPAAAPTPYFTPKMWRENPTMQVQLRTLLDHPLMKIAEMTLLMQAMPAARATVEPTPEVSADAMNASFAYRYHHRSGFAGYRNGLHNLTRVDGAKKNSEVMWGELLPEDE